MSKIRLLVVEDNDLHFFKMEAMSADLGYEIVGRVEHSDEVIRTVKATDPDVIMMDVMLKGDKNGVELAAQINETSQIPIIFTTSATDSETITSAINTDPSGYLIKPITPESLQAAVELAIYKVSNAVSQNNDKIAETFFVKKGEEVVQVRTEDILWVAASEQEKYVTIHTAGEMFMVRFSVKRMLEKLPDYFVRVSSSCGVNSNKISKINEELMTIFVGGQELKMSRKYKAELKQRLNFLN